ncbi:hypothetical protein [Paenibacillus lutrae]|uniref:Uncharacterized protein n=1 Tax=Paenibacillus lutrae TaxID=2078573 RepID=A0A7X3FLR5_9BACL|nr:hypothetical protein [Paenibacillus lutrae]MVP02099.1 hypothetical protein [Paenibacillus lutrae]
MLGLNSQFVPQRNPAGRKERSDKLKDIKFPITPELRRQLRRHSEDAKNQTVANTKILIEALQLMQHSPERFPVLDYQDTGIYMHAKPPLHYHEQIRQLVIDHDERSIRSMTHRLIMNYLNGGTGK